MHTFEGNRIRIHHNQDMSGDCYIFDKETLKEIKVNCEDIVNFVIENIKCETKD